VTQEHKGSRRFDGKVAVVTGAGNGIGLAIAHAFAAEGAEVAIAEINPQSAERARDEIRKAGGRAISVPTDVSDEGQVERMVSSVVSSCGRIDILVNNAGIVVHKPLVELEREAWDKQLAVQATGPFLTIKHVGRHMISRGGPGKIVNISSVASLMGRVKVAAHCAAKGALNMLTKVAAMEFAAYNINVNAIAPGLVDVPAQRAEDNVSTAYKNAYLKMMPLQRMGEPADIARGTLFLASSEADWITGQLLVADGGLMAGHFALQGLHDHVALTGH
jgi:NAD(P)-dependent dehydrogenase (short-subunit alcohol dehydrogenase family)